MKKQPARHQLNIRLTPHQDQMIRQKAIQAQKTKTQLILDSLNNIPIYQLPDLPQALQQIKYLGTKTNELSRKLDEKDINTPELKELIKNLQQGCDELWQLLKSLRQAVQNQA